MAALLLTPTLWAGVSGDDVYRGAFAAIAPVDGISFGQASAVIARQYAHESGGFFPLSQSVLLLWQLGPSPALARVVQLLLLFADVAALQTVSGLAFRSRRAGLLAVTIFLTTVAMTKFHDPVLTQIGTWPLLALILLASIGCWLHESEKERPSPRVLAGCVTAFALALLFNEAALGAVLVFLALALIDRRKPFLVTAAAIAACGAAEIALWHLGDGPAAGWRRVVAEISAGTYLRDVTTQFAAAVPGVTHAFGGLVRDGRSGSNGDTRYIDVARVYVNEWVGDVVAAAVVFGGLQALRTRSVSLRPPLVIGCALWLGAALALGPPTMWPHGLPGGEAFPSVFLERIGFALVATVVVIRAAQSARLSFDIVQIVATLAVVIAIYANARLDHTLIDRLQPEVSAQNLLREARDAGAFDNVASGAAVVADTALPYRFEPGVRNARYLYYQLTGRRFDVLPPWETNYRSPLCAHRDAERCEAPPERYWATQVFDTRTRAFTIARWSDTTRGGIVETEDAYRYERFPDTNARRGAVSTARLPTRGARIAATPVLADRMLEHIVRVCGSVPIDRIQFANGPTFRWGTGFLPPPKNSAEIPRYFYASQGLTIVPGRDPAFRFAGRHAELDIVRDPCPTNETPVTIRVATGTPARLTLETSQGEIVRTDISEQEKPIVVPIDPGTGRVVRVTLDTDAAPSEDYPLMARYDDAKPMVFNMLVFVPTPDGLQ